MHLDELLSVLERLAPLELAEDWDNVGLLIAPSRPREIDKLLLTIDLSRAVLGEAIDTGAQLIVSYHPPIFDGLRRLVPSELSAALAIECIEHGLAVYSPHTALDAVPGGVNDWLAGGLDALASRAIIDKRALIGESTAIVGQGRLLELRYPLSPREAVARIKQHLGLQHVRYAGAGAKAIRSVASCPGAGGSVVSRVAADLILTGEMRHHDVLAANARGTHVVLTEHTNSERGYLPVFARLLSEELAAAVQSTSEAGVEVIVSRADADPLSIA